MDSDDELVAMVSMAVCNSVAVALMGVDGRLYKAPPARIFTLRNNTWEGAYFHSWSTTKIMVNICRS